MTESTQTLEELSEQLWNAVDAAFRGPSSTRLARVRGADVATRVARIVTRLRAGGNASDYVEPRMAKLLSEHEVFNPARPAAEAWDAAWAAAGGRFEDAVEVVPTPAVTTSKAEQTKRGLDI